MSKILFISPPYENLGIEYMSALLKSAGHKVDLIVDPCLFFNAYQKNHFLGKLFNYKIYIVERVKKIKPDLICFSIMTDTYQWGLDLAKRIKDKTDALIVFGGIHPTIVPEVVINERQVDYACVGEGEEAILKLANRFLEPHNCVNIANMWTKRDGKIIKNSSRPLCQDLDRLPFPDKDLYYRESKIYSKEYFIMVGRGCNYSCAFCCNQIFLRIYGSKFLRRRTVGNVIEELSQSKRKYGFKFVWFMDDNFPIDISWLKEFSREYHRHIDVPFFCYMHPNNMTYEVANLLKKANCYEVAIGVESLNENTCRFINRNTDKITIKEALEALRSKRIISITENILGFPGENGNDIVKLIDFYNKNRPDLIMFSWLKIFPGTSLLKLLRTKNMISNQAFEDIINGNDRSLALGGNYADVRTFKKAACLLVLLPFLPKTIVRFLLKTKLFRYFVFLNPNFLLSILRIYKTTKLAMLTTGKKTYDAGARISMRIYRHFMAKKLRLISSITKHHQ